jgi:hypothetical protein
VKEEKANDDEDYKRKGKMMNREEKHRNKTKEGEDLRRMR